MSSSVEEVLVTVSKVELLDLDTFKTVQFHLELEGTFYLVSFANMNAKTPTPWDLSALSATITEYIRQLSGKDMIMSMRTLPISPDVSKLKQ